MLFDISTFKIHFRVPLKIRVKPNADRIFESNENDRRHSRKAMSREFEAAIGNYSKFGKIIIFRGALYSHYK